MEAKYYTPTLEEFHVGFEYENLRFDPEWKLACTWYSANIANNRLLSEVFRNYEVGYLNDIDTKEPLYRVKCLDREDIEKCGFKYSILASKHVIFYGEEMSVWLEMHDEKIKITDCRNPLHEIVFQGKIKNVSELKKLMQQLNIE